MSLVPLEMVLATNSAMLGADLSKTRDEHELTRNKGTKDMAASKSASGRRCAAGIGFAEATRRPCSLLIGKPKQAARRLHAERVRS
ncbi:MAG: hypothetical protein J2P48_01995 [Alphaproteobacteria bacterium]|nr:hypothetical protein [Alphaproteobacteria bacterium]